ncbi:MAG: hypothetical protein ACLQD8_07805 [Thermoplasmata archaeon]
MGTGSSWFVSIIAILGLVLALHQLGVNASATLGTVLWGMVRALGQPLFAVL